MITSPYVVLRISWRYLYYITSGVGILVWLLLIAFVPETRWIRSDDELGKSFCHKIDFHHDNEEVSH